MSGAAAARLVSAVDRRAWRFFQREAGGIVGRAAIYAWELERAEALGEALGWRVRWDEDADPDLSWCEQCEEQRADRKARRRRPGPEHVHRTFVAVLEDARGLVLGSLGNVDFGPGETPAGASYARLVSAELMLQAIEEA